MRVVAGHFLVPAFVLSGGLVHAEGLPEFDPLEFNIVSLEQDSRAIVRSGERDFLCEFALDEEVGFVAVQRCIPFVNLLEAAEAMAAQARRDAEAASAASEAAAADAEAKAEAEQDLKMKSAHVLDQIASLDSSTAEAAVIAVARDHECQIDISGGGVSSIRLLQLMAQESGVDLSMHDFGGINAARAKFGDAIVSLAAAGLAEIVDDKIGMKLKDCN